MPRPSEAFCFSPADSERKRRAKAAAARKTPSSCGNRRETPGVTCIDDAVVYATLPYLPEVVADMVRLQRLTGARPGEICSLRPCDLDRSSDVWLYSPCEHKTEHHEKERVIVVGPQASEQFRIETNRLLWRLALPAQDFVRHRFG